MNQVRLSRASLALLVVLVLIGGVALGGAVATFGTATASPTATPTIGGDPTASAEPLPATDVEGADLVRLPRFPGSVRTEFEISVDDRYRLTAVEYLAAADVDDVRTFYQGVIAEHGWQRADIGFSGGEWTYVLVDGATEALVEIEETGGRVEIDLQLSDPVAAEHTRAPAPQPTPVPTQAPAAPPPPPRGDDDDDGGGDDGDDGEEDGGSDDDG